MAKLIAPLFALFLPLLSFAGFSSPQDWQVFQRDATNRGEILVRGSVPAEATVVTARLLRADGTLVVEHSDEGLARRGQEIELALTAPAGGWYRLELISRRGGKELETVEVAHVGVGEVFVTAGQSNSVPAGESAQVSGMLTSYASYGNNAYVWRQPIDYPGHPGTPWAVFATALSETLKMPVAVTMLGCGGTTVGQWLPAPNGNPAPAWCGDAAQPGGLYDRLQKAVKAMGPFRALLWHQGESDAAYATSAEVYYQSLKSIMASLEKDSARKHTWFVANVSYIPGREIKNEIGCPLTGAPVEYLPRMAPVRAAQQRLWAEKLALRGPDTDDLFGGAYRYAGPAGACIHFSNRGLLVHGLRWVDAVRGFVPGT